MYIAYQEEIQNVDKVVQYPSLAIHNLHMASQKI